MSVSISVFYDFRRRSALVDAKRDATNWSAVLTTESHLFCPLFTPSHAGTGWLIAWRHTTTINSISTSVRRRSHWPVDARVFKYACSVIWREKQKKRFLQFLFYFSSGVSFESISRKRKRFISYFTLNNYSWVTALLSVVSRQTKQTNLESQFFTFCYISALENQSINHAVGDAPYVC